MIPKKIHYCWFGGNPLPELALKCIQSWKEFCPDYEIIEWNESNFDIEINKYVKEAYEAKKWAFVTDYVRLYVLVNYGGVYMDTDVEVIKNIDIFLKHRAFSGFEREEAIPTGIMACEENFPLFNRLLNEYEERSFYRKDGSFDLTTNVTSITRSCEKLGLKLNNKLQNIEDFVLYPKDFFCPKSYKTGEINCTKNTFTIHHFAGSWQDKKQKKIRNFEREVIKIYGEKNIIINSIIYKIIVNLYILGIKRMIMKSFGYFKNKGEK